jgi:hypothetical protein
MDSFEEMTGFTFSNSTTSDQCKVFEKLGFDITFPLTFLCIGPQNLQGLSIFLTINESRDELLDSNPEDKTSSDVFDSNVEGALLVNASSKCIFFASFAAFFYLVMFPLRRGRCSVFNAIHLETFVSRNQTSSKHE